MKEILVIDDDSMILHSVERQLRSLSSINLTLESNPQVALVKIDSKRFDLIICDMKMKPITGVDVLKHIKTNYPEIPVVVLTGYVDDSMMEEVNKIGCDDFLIKPIRKKVLIDVINKFL